MSRRWIYLEDVSEGIIVNLRLFAAFLGSYLHFSRSLAFSRILSRSLAHIPATFNLNTLVKPRTVRCPASKKISSFFIGTTI